MDNIFISNNEKYELNASIGCGGNNFSLLMDDIDVISYSNEMNRLYNIGYVEYTDRRGIIDKVIEEQELYFVYELTRFKENVCGSIVKIEYEQTIKVKFLVNNIEILENTPDVVKYKINIISENYTNLNKNVHFSNYKDKDKPLIVSDIIKEILLQSDNEVDETSFSANVSGTKLKYISNVNDNVFSSVNYLLRRTVYNHDIGIDRSLKTLVYNEGLNVIRLYSTQVNSILNGQYPPVQLNMLKSSSLITDDIPVGIGYVSRSSRVDGMLATKQLEYMSYDINTNEIGNSKTQNSTLMNTINGTSDNTNPKFNTPIDTSFSERQTTWSGNIDRYDKMIDALTKSNGLIVNCYGFIGAIPGFNVPVTIAKSVGSSTDDLDHKEFEELAYERFSGDWKIFKIEHFILPKKNRFRQKLVLFRNKL